LSPVHVRLLLTYVCVFVCRINVVTQGDTMEVEVLRGGEVMKLSYRLQNPPLLVSE
jgi:hypothetical protein